MEAVGSGLGPDGEGGEGEGFTTTDPYLMCEEAGDGAGGEEDDATFFMDTVGAATADDSPKDAAAAKDAPTEAAAAASALAEAMAVEMPAAAEATAAAAEAPASVEAAAVAAEAPAAAAEADEEEEEDDMLFFVDTAGRKEDAAPPAQPAAAPVPPALAPRPPAARPPAPRPPVPRPPPRPPPAARREAQPEFAPDRISRARLLARRACAAAGPAPAGFPLLRPRSEHPLGVWRLPDPVFTTRPPTAADGFGAARALEAAHDARAAGAGFEALCGECLEALRTTCSEALSGEEFRVAPFDWTPDVRLEPFGSTRQGTALRTSDLDVRLSFQQFEVREDQRQLRYLEGIAARPGPNFTVVRLVRARLPVLRLRYRDQLEVDVSLGEDMAGGAEVDAAVRGLLEAAVDEGARRFVKLVKMFAKAHGLVDAYAGFLNSVSWVFLALAFLQLESCIPSLARLQPGVARRALWPARPTLSLLMRFFSFACECAQSPHHISLAKGEVRASSPFTWSGNAAAKLFVEHPTKPGQNIAHSLVPDGWATTAGVCAEARKRLASALRAPASEGAGDDGCGAAISWLLQGDGTAVDGPGEEGGTGPAKRRRLDAETDGGACAADGRGARGSGPVARPASFRDCASCGTVHRCPGHVPAERPSYCPECRRGYRAKA